MSHSPPHPHETGLAVSETVKSEFDRRRRSEREKWKHLPSRYKGYEALLSAEPDPNVVVPKGGGSLGTDGREIVLINFLTCVIPSLLPYQTSRHAHWPYDTY